MADTAKLAVFTQEDVERLSETVAWVERQLKLNPRTPKRPLPEGGGGVVRLGVFKEDMPSGGEAKGVLLIPDAARTGLVEETTDPAKFRTFVDRLAAGSVDGISGINGRRCYVAPDILPGGKWMVINTTFDCSG